MIKHHPDDNLLVEYSAGALDWALAISVSTHLHYCKECQARVCALSHVGGAMLREAKASESDADLLSKTLAKIKAAEAQQITDEGGSTETVSAQAATAQRPQRWLAKLLKQRKPEDSILFDLPKVVNKMMPKAQEVKWRFMSPSLKTAKLQSGQDKYDVCFYRISAGGKVIEHDHNGLEVTVVLKGSFSDGNGVYSEGDFLVKNPGEVHKPTAAQNQDCLCLTITEAPVALTGLMGKVFNPLIRQSAN